jgi:hypothetical protein
VVEFAEFVPLVFATVPELQAHTMGLSLEIALRVAVEESLAAHHTTNAIFLAERLLACSTSNIEHRHLLASAYLAAGETYKAYSTLRQCSSAKNR